MLKSITSGQSILLGSIAISVSLLYVGSSLVSLNKTIFFSETRNETFADKPVFDIADHGISNLVPVSPQMELAIFTEKFRLKFPSLSSARITSTDSLSLWAVSYNNTTIYFTTDLKVALDGNISSIPMSDNQVISPTVEGYPERVIESQPTQVLADKSNANLNESPSELIPPNRHTGVVRPAYSKGLATIDRTMLPYFKATNNRNDSNPKTLLTFVDTTCPACKRFVSKIQVLNEAGIDVYLAPFPRGGARSSSASLMSYAWCSDDNEKRKSNVIRAFSSKLIGGQCELPDYQKNIDASFDFGEHYLNKTTPVSFTHNGIIVIANLEVKDFVDAMDFGDKLAAYAESNIQD